MQSHVVVLYEIFRSACVFALVIHFFIFIFAVCAARSPSASLPQDISFAVRGSLCVVLVFNGVDFATVGQYFLHRDLSTAYVYLDAGTCYAWQEHTRADAEHTRAEKEHARAERLRGQLLAFSITSVE